MWSVADNARVFLRSILHYHDARPDELGRATFDKVRTRGARRGRVGQAVRVAGSCHGAAHAAQLLSARARAPAHGCCRERLTGCTRACVLLWRGALPAQDDDAAVEFVAAASNLRSACYGIPTQALFDAKGMAGNIIHAIATTNAVISGLIVAEALKLLAGGCARTSATTTTTSACAPGDCGAACACARPAPTARPTAAAACGQREDRLLQPQQQRPALRNRMRRGASCGCCAQVSSRSAARRTSWRRPTGTGGCWCPRAWTRRAPAACRAGAPC